MDSASHSLIIATAMTGTRTLKQMVTASSRMVQYIFDIDKWATPKRHIFFELGRYILFPKILARKNILSVILQLQNDLKTISQINY